MELSKFRIAFFHRLKEEFYPPYKFIGNHIENIAVVLQAYILSIYNEKNYTSEVISKFDIIFIELSLQDENLFKFCYYLLKRKEIDKFFIIGVVEGCPFDFNRYSGEKQFALFDLYRKIDALFILHPDFRDHYYVFNKKIIDCGVPYPVEFTKSVPRRIPSIFTIELVNIFPDDRNTLYNLSLFEYIYRRRKKEKKHTNFKGVCTTILNQKDIEKVRYLFPHITFLKADKLWKEYFIWKKQNISLTISMDHRYALGRVSIDSCAASIPCIGTYRSFYQRRLFPDLCCEINDFQKVYHLVDEFLNGRQYKFVSLDSYSEDNWKKRFIENLKKIGFPQ